MIDEKWLEDNAANKNPFEFEDLELSMKGRLRMSGWKIDPVCGLYNNDKDIRACPVAVLPVALYRSVSGGAEKVELKFWDVNHWESIIADRELIASRSRIIELANRGVEVTSDNAGKLVKALGAILGESRDIIPRYSYSPRLGWAGKEFVPYSEKVLFDAQGEYRYIADSIRSRGTAEEWARYMAPLLSNHRLRLTVAASFASPMIKLTGQSPFIMHLWGKTGYGKTVAAMAAASVWGDPERGRYMKTLNATGNAMLTMASVLNSLPLIADELQTIRCGGENFDRLIMTLTEGINRARMNRNRMEQTLSWENSFILTGEQPITGSSSGGGAVNRVLQIEVCGPLMPDGRETANFLRSHYGGAGRVFVESLEPEQVRQDFDYYRECLKSRCDAEKTEGSEKQLMSMALVMAADRQMRRLFFEDSLSEFSPDEIMPCLNNAKEIDISERAYEYICNVISANSQAFTVDARESWGIISGEKVFINFMILEREMSRGGFELSTVKRSWVQNGYMLFNTKDKRYRFHKMVWGTSTSCACIIVPYCREEE